MPFSRCFAPACAFLLSLGSLAMGEPWTVHAGRFGIFELPPTMRPNLDATGIDSFVDPYISNDFDINFDCTVMKVPADMQERLERAVAAWAEQRKSDWTKRLQPELGMAVIGSATPSDLNPPTMPNYLYLGFAIGKDAAFAIHIYFRKTEQLGDVERFLRSIKLKSP